MDLFWLLIFAMLFFMYIDIRISRLKNELLQHYRLFEELLPKTSRISENFSNGNQEFGIINGSNIDITNLIPSAEETRIGIQNIASLAGQNWGYQQEQTSNQAQPLGFGDGDDLYASVTF